MSKQVEVATIRTANWGKRRRSLPLVLLIVYVVVSSFAFGGNVPEGETGKSSKLKSVGTGLRLADSYPSVSAGNVAANPAPTFGPNCVGRVIVLIDRSHSVINIAESDGRGRFDYVNEMKFAMASVINQLGLGAEKNNSQLYFIPIAFAASGVVQTPYFGSTLADFLNYVSSMNIAVPANRTKLYSDIGFNDQGIFYRDNTAMDFITTGNAIIDLINKTRGYDPVDNGTTNWQGAFDAARAQIQFWTPGTASDGDDDFDLVLMVTDGIPTTSNNDLSGPWINPDTSDLIAAQAGINALRLGAFGTIPPTPVHGLVVGRDAQRSDIDEIMGKTFGASNYTLENNWSNLQSTINNVIKNYSCIPEEIVKPGISVTATPIPVAIREGEQGSISVTVENIGDVPLTGVTVEMQPSGNKDEVVKMFDLLNPGEVRTFTHSYHPNITLGMPAPAMYTASAHAWAVLGPKQTVSGGYSSQPVSIDSFEIPIIRLPLPA